MKALSLSFFSIKATTSYFYGGDISRYLTLSGSAFSDFRLAHEVTLRPSSHKINEL